VTHIFGDDDINPTQSPETSRTLVMFVPLCKAILLSSGFEQKQSGSELRRVDEIACLEKHEMRGRNNDDCQDLAWSDPRGEG
jgi:hypothetical protein